MNVSRRKGLAMLAYLAATGQTHSRDTLATLFWPNSSQRRARGNLRRALSALKKEIGADVLIFEGETISLATGEELWLDVERFGACLEACATHGHPPEEICGACLPLLDEAVDLYQADFLAGFTLRDTVAFDDWQYFEAESLRRQYAAVLERLVDGLSVREEYDAAIPYARRRLALDPLHEPAQQLLMQLYHQAGQSSAALRQYELYEALLEEELGVPPGEETTALFEAIKASRQSGSILRQLPTASPGPGQKAAPARHDHLPAQPTAFVGREQEIAELRRLLLEEPGCRLLTLLGPGGMGKTRLALEVATRVAAAFGDGAHFVSLAPVAEAEFIGPSIAEALQLNFQGNVDLTKQLLLHLRQKNYLLILDNFEHLLTTSISLPPGSGSGEALLSQIAYAAPDSKLLVTSRERLNLQEEWVYNVPGMSLPEENDSLDSDPQALEAYAAIRLFLQRARKAHVGFAASAADRAAIIRICRLVGGMPLAIELAAPWVRVMSCGDIADEIKRGFDLLTTSLSNVPARHRSMRAILEQTWQQLPLAEQAVLGKLSVFRGGFLRDAAEKVAAATLPLLASLVDKALLRRAGGRYEIHELVRQFSQEQLQRSPEHHTQTLNRHYRYYMEFLERQVAKLKGGPQLETLQWMAAEMGNVRVAWQRAVDLRDMDAISQGAEGLFMYSEMRGELMDAETGFRRAIGDLSEILEADLAGSDLPTFESRLGFLLVMHGILAMHIGNLNGPAMTRRGAELVRTHAAIAGRYRTAYCSMLLGWSDFSTGRYEESEDRLDESHATFAALGERWGMAKSLYMISNSYIARGQIIKAEKALQQSLALCRQIGDARSRILVNRTLAIVTLFFGEMSLTRQLLEEAVSLSEDFNDLFGLQNALRELGKLEMAQGNLEQSAAAFHRCIDVCYEFGAEWEGELTRCDLGALLRVQGDYEMAEEELQRGLSATLSTKNRWWLPRCKSELGCLAAARAEYDLARQLLSEALVLWKEVNHEPYQAWGMAQLGHIAAAQGENRPAAARNHYYQGLVLALKNRQAPVALDIFAGMVGLLREEGEIQQASRIFSLVVDHPATTYETRQKARSLLASAPLPTVEETAPPPEWQAAATTLIEILGPPT